MYSSKPNLYIESYSSYRKNHDYVKKLNRILFSRNIDIERESILIDAINNKISKKDAIEKLDVYSLGITIVSLLLDKFGNRLVNIFDTNDIKPFAELLRHMTEMDSKNRIKPGTWAKINLSEGNQDLNFFFYDSPIEFGPGPKISFRMHNKENKYIILVADCDSFYRKSYEACDANIVITNKEDWTKKVNKYFDELKSE